MPSKQSPVQALVADLQRLIKADPSNPNAGNFAVAISNIHAAEIRKDHEVGLWGRINVDANSLFARIAEEAHKTNDERTQEPPAPKPPTDKERREAAARFVKQAMAFDVAGALIQEASGFERLAELGREQQGGMVTAGVSERPSFTEAQRKKYRERATDLRDRAIKLLVDSGIDQFPDRSGHAMMAAGLRY